jgi:2-oxoglutarate dehydrogenase E1 component
VIIDQYIVSAEEKWNVKNDLVMFLPHGYEAQGPDHSSARMERFLSLCVDDNIIVANCTSPANLFHLLRRHKLHNIRKPLIVFTPKSLLRHPECVSPVSELINGAFRKVIDDSELKAVNVSGIIFCTGKIYFDLYDEMKKREIKDTVIIRIEQIYPFPDIQVKSALKKYKNANKLLWVQEEPENMGALQFMKKNFEALSFKMQFIGRPESASPASGLKKIHQLQHNELMKKTFE